MNAVTEIRQQYNLSQLKMASQLGISRSLLSMVEIGKRDLPLEALKKLNILSMSYEKKAGKKTISMEAAMTVKEQAAMRKHLKQLLAKAERKARQLKIKLDLMAATYSNGLLQATGIQKIMNNLAKNSKQNDQEKSLQFQLMETNNRVRHNTMLHQTVLQIKLHCLNIEITLLQQLLQTPVSKGFSIK